MRIPQADKVKVGTRFGRLKINQEPYLKTYGKYGPRRICPCVCDCGVELEVWANRLLIENGTRSCGCRQRERTSQSNTKHGEGHSLLYGVWIAMKDRCANPKNKDYGRYGGRGIAVCPQWIHDFAAFREWANANGYRQGLTIERNDVNGNYEPENCSWIPMGDQRRNTTYLHHVTAFGETKLLQDWCRDPRCRVVRLTLYSRLKSGWDAETAIVTPAQKKGSTGTYIRHKPIE